MEIEKRRNYNFYDILGDRAKLWFTLMYGRLLLKRLIIVDVVKTEGGDRVHFCLPVLSAGITPRLSGVDARDVKRVATYQPKNSSSDLLAAIKASKHERSPLGCPISRVSWPPDTTPPVYTCIYSPLLFFLLTPPFFRVQLLHDLYCRPHTRIVSYRVEIVVEGYRAL